MHSVAMPSSTTSTTTTAAEQINMDTLLPTYCRPRRAYIFPPLDPHPSNNRTSSLEANSVVAVSGARKLYTFVKEHAAIIGILITVLSFVAAVFGIIVGVVVAVVIK